MDCLHGHAAKANAHADIGTTMNVYGTAATVVVTAGHLRQRAGTYDLEHHGG